MIVHDCIQGTTEWLSVRAGIPTASMFDDHHPEDGQAEHVLGWVHAPAPGRAHPQAASRAAGVLRWSGTTARWRATRWRSTSSSARSTRSRWASSPTTRGRSAHRGPPGETRELLEIKCPSEAVHMGYLLHGSLGQKHKPQVQGQLWVTGHF